MQTNTRIADIAGWYGTVVIILAYALNSSQFITSDSISYQLLNLTGAIGMVIMGMLKKVYQPAVLNTVWATIALIAILRILL